MYIYILYIFNRTNDADYAQRARSDFYQFLDSETRRIFRGFAGGYCEIPLATGRTRMAVRCIRTLQHVYFQTRRLLNAIEGSM